MARSCSKRRRIHDQEPVEIKDSKICQLPKDVQINILLELPIKSVFRCKYVSKEWRTLISDPYFTDCYQKPEISGYYFYCEGTAELQSLSLNNEETGEVPSISSMPFLQHRYCVWGSCNGLLISHSANENKLYITNSLTKNWVSIPAPIHGPDHTMLGVGLAFDPCNSPRLDIVVLIELKSDERRLMIAVTYRSERSEWGDPSSIFFLSGEQPIRGGIEQTLPWPIEMPRQCALFYNGSLHWISRYKRRDVVLIFNHNSMVKEEQIRLIKLPGKVRYLMEMEMDDDGVNAWVVNRACLGVSNGTLHYVTYDHDFEKLHVWVPRGYLPSSPSVKWDLVHEIDFAPMVMSPLVPFGFHEDMKELFVCQRGKIVSYHLQTLACRVICEVPEEHGDDAMQWALFFPYFHGLLGPT